jgi:hypothetical protein
VSRAVTPGDCTIRDRDWAMGERSRKGMAHPKTRRDMRQHDMPQMLGVSAGILATGLESAGLAAARAGRPRGVGSRK